MADWPTRIGYVAPAAGVAVVVLTVAGIWTAVAVSAARNTESQLGYERATSLQFRELQARIDRLSDRVQAQQHDIADYHERMSRALGDLEAQMRMHLASPPSKAPPPSQ